MAERGGGYPGRYQGKATSGVTHGKSVDSQTAVWYKIPIFQVGELTTRLNPEISQLLETAYQQGRMCVSFKDNDTGSSFIAYLEKKQLWLQGSFKLHAHLERVCEARQPDTVDRGQTPQTSNENKSNDVRVRQMMVDQYKDNASKLADWLKDVTNGIMQKQFPADLKDMKSELAEIGRIQTEEIPVWAERKKEILRIYEDLQNCGAKPVTIDESLFPDTIQQLCEIFDSERNKRQTRLLAEVARLEKLQALLERIHQETENLEVTLRKIEHHIKDMKKDQNTLKEKQNFDALAGELKNIEDRIISLGTDVQALQQGEYLYMDEVNKFLRLQSRADQIKTSFFSVSSQISPSKVSVNNAMIIAQYQESFNKDMVETNHAFQHVQSCLLWLQTKQSTLEDEWYGRDINSIKEALSEHTQKHRDIISFNIEVEQCIKDRETQSKKEQEQYNQWLCKVQDAYTALLNSSLQRLQRLQLSLDFVQAAEQELNWLKEKIEQICNCSPDLLNMPCEQIYQDVVMGMRSREAHFNLVQERGISLASQIHPAKVTIETFILDMKSHWVWLQLFLECLNMHSVHMSDYMKFFGEAQRCETWMSQNKETIDKWTRLQNLPLEELQKMKKECHDLQIDLVRYDKDVASLCKSSCCIIPFKERLPHVTFQNKILCLCNYEQPTMTLRNGEECTLLDNSQSVRWKVRNSRGEEDTVLSICLQILPPNLEAVDLAERLKIQLDELKTLLRNLIQNIVLSQIQFIKALDVKQFKLQDQANHEALLRNVNIETGKLIKEVGEADQEMKHLQKELDECNQGFHNLIRELQEEEKRRKNKTLDEDLIEKLETCSRQLNNLYQDLKHREQLPTSVDKNTVVKACQEQSEWEKTVQQQECCIEELKQAVQKLLTRHHQIESLLKNIIQMWDEMTRLGKTYADREHCQEWVKCGHKKGPWNTHPDCFICSKCTRFAWQWEKFEMRFEIKKANRCMSSTNYSISDVSPVKIQYISNIESENNSLLHKLSTRNLKGVFESDLLRILLEEEEYIRTRTEDQIHFSYLKKEVIAILKCHIKENPSIEEEHLALVTLDNVRKAHELQNLECVISGRVNIYISRSGEGVTIVGREIGKYIESINSALEQRSKNEPDSRTHYPTEGAVSSVSEPKRSKGKHDTGSEAFTDESLEHFEETEEETKKSGEVSEFESHVILTELTVQMLKASNFQGESSKDISAVSVVMNRNEVVFQGTPEVVQKAEARLVQYLKSKGYWHEINETASFIEATKRLNFEDHLKRKLPDVHIIFTDMKITFFGERSLASEDELSHFRSSIERCVIQYDGNFILNYLKLLDVQKYIWEQFEKKHILCFWQVTETGIELFSRNDEQFAAAETIFEECIAVTDLDPSRTEVQEIEKSPNWRKLCDINKGMLLREVLHAGCVIYVGMPEVIKQIKELYCRLVEQGNLPQIHSLQVLLSQPVLSYVRKYLMENIKQQFEVNCILLADKSGIMITGSKESVQGAVCEVQNQLQQLSIDVCPLRNPKVTQTPTGQVKVIVDAMEEENKTIIEIISLPRKGKDTMRVPISAALDVSLLYGSTSGRDIGMQLIPVNDRLFPFCLAAIDIMEKVDLVRKAATCFEQYVKNKDGQKPVDFMFIPDDFNSNQCIVYFVMPENPSDIKDFEQKFKQGLLPVLDYACQRKITSMSLPLEMHDLLPVRQMFTIIMDILKIYIEKAESQKIKSEVFLCSVDRTNYSIVRKLLDNETHDEEDTMESFVLEEDLYDSNDESESEVDITIITGNLTEQKVDIIVNSTSQSLNLNQGYVSKSILDAAGSTIQDECIEKYPHGIQFGEIAVTSAGNLGCKKIFHGALHKKNEKYLQTIRWLMKNCLQTAGKEKLHSIAFPALGIGKLEYPVEVVAKEMFQAVTQSAQRHGVKTVKFVLQEGEKKTYQTFQQMANIRERALRDAQNPDFNPKFEVHLEGCRLKVHIVATEKKSSVCDVDVFLSSPPAGTLIETVLLEPDGFFGSKKILEINRDPGQWGEKLYLCWDRVLDLKHELVHAVDYMKLMKFTSFAVYLVQDLTLQESQNAIESVILTLDIKKPFDDLEKVTVIVSNDMFLQMTQWLKEKVHESINRTTTFWKKINFFSITSHKGPVKPLFNRTIPAIIVEAFQ